MADIKMAAVVRIAKQLEALGARYHITFEGQEFGSKKPVRPRNGVLLHVGEHLSNIKAGEIARLEPNELYNMDQLQAAACNFMRTRFGSGSYITSRESGALEVLCLSGEPLTPSDAASGDNSDSE